MKLALACTLLLGCVDGLAPGEVGIGRRVGMFPGEVAAVLPPLTDRTGNLYVVTGVPDSTGVPQPGVAHTGSARGGWSDGCATGEGVRGGARGWIGATDGEGWLWTGTAILALDVASGTCAALLDTDPVSNGDIVFHAVAPLVDETVSGNFALAAISIGASPTVYLVTIDLGLGLIRQSNSLGEVEVLATGADHSSREAAFLVRDGSGARIAIARANEITPAAVVPVTGALVDPPLTAELAFGANGSIAGVLADDQVLLGSRTIVTATRPPFLARGLERDDADKTYLVGLAGTMPTAAAVSSTGALATEMPWTCAVDIDAALAAGIVVVDDRSGAREAVEWEAHGAAGGPALVQRFTTPSYAVGARALLVADPAVDRGGVKYSQLAVVPVGVELP